MPLVPTTLALNLFKLSSNNPKNAEEYAKKLAAAYDSYAKAAIALGGTPILVGTEKTTLEVNLLPAVKNVTSGSIATYAAAWYQGVVLYWTPVVWTPPPGYGPGLMTIPPAALIQSSLVSALSSPNSAQVGAQSHANALHSGVAGIMTVTFPPVPPTPAPLIAPVL